jgi:hypothetical protein
MKSKNEYEPGELVEPDPVAGSPRTAHANPTKTGDDPGERTDPGHTDDQIVPREDRHTKRTPGLSRRSGDATPPDHATRPDPGTFRSGSMTGSYRRGFCAGHEARYLLSRQGWYVTRCSGHEAGPDLMAVRKGEFLLVVVRHSRQPVSSARAVASLYADDLRRLRLVESPGWVRKEAWVQAPPDGWRFYEVFPGGIRRVVRDSEGIAVSDAKVDEDFT